jgi:hypothetical protein
MKNFWTHFGEQSGQGEEEAKRRAAGGKWGA